MQGLVPKVVRYMAEIRYFVGFQTKFQLVVLKLLSVVSCEEGRFLFLLFWRSFFLWLGREICTAVDVLSCREWFRKWFGIWLKFDILWDFGRIIVKLVVLKILTVVSCDGDGFVRFVLLGRTFFCWDKEAYLVVDAL